MKVNQIVKYNFIIIVLLIAQSSQSKDQIEKKRVVEKYYNVSASTSLKISNKFGKVEINSWDKKEFAIKVEVIGKGRSDERAQRILDQIDIAIDKGSTEISFTTSIDKMKK